MGVVTKAHRQAQCLLLGGVSASDPGRVEISEGWGDTASSDVSVCVGTVDAGSRGLCH